MAATARVRLTIEIDAGSTWGDDCTARQIYDQASKEARHAIDDMILGSNKIGTRCKIVGKPEVDMIVLPLRTP